MTVLFWLFLLWIFFKCVGWVIAPFRRTREARIDERQEYVYIYITDSFNTDSRQIKGGNSYELTEFEKKTYGD